jgi:DNA-binding transcriptional LysR family regulator
VGEPAGGRAGRQAEAVRNGRTRRSAGVQSTSAKPRRKSASRSRAGIVRKVAVAVETFLAAMELGSVTSAAARLNLSKSVVSKRIADLERALRAALFLRSAGRIASTEAARNLAERLRPAHSDLRAAAESVAWGMDGAVPLRGRLAIAAPMSFGTLHLGPILARFAAAHPGLDLVSLRRGPSSRCDRSAAA